MFFKSESNQFRAVPESSTQFSRRSANMSNATIGYSYTTTDNSAPFGVQVDGIADLDESSRSASLEEPFSFFFLKEPLAGLSVPREKACTMKRTGSGSVSPIQDVLIFACSHSHGILSQVRL